MFNTKKDYFKKKLEAVTKTVWDLEFKKEKTLMIREEIRQEYDTLKSKLSILDEEITRQKENPTKEAGEIARLDDQKVILTRDIERYEGQMKGLDIEVYGSPKTNEYPDGIQGIDQQIDALEELKGMLNNYIKQL